MRRNAGCLALLATLAATAGCGAGERSAPPPPNVLLVFVDTLRADRLGAYGYPLDTSPHVDALAAQGAVFLRAISGASSTSPSHASIFSSRYTRGHTVGMANGSTRLEGVTTLAEVFGDAGYATAAFVGNAMLNRRLGFDRGFDLYDDELPTREGSRTLFERRADATTERALAWLAKRDGEGDEAPFFLWVHYQDPHGPYAPPEEFLGRLPIAPRPGERPLSTKRGGRGGNRIPQYQVLPGLTLPSAYESRYGEEILYADWHIGALLASVDARAERDTIVLLTADHGEALGEAGRFFEHGLATTPDQSHVPFIVRAPGVPPGRRDDVVHHVDVSPTLLGLAGLSTPEGMRGLALGPYLRSGEPLPDRLVYCDDGRELSAYRGGEFVRVSLGGRAPSFERHAWEPGGGWSPRAGVDRGWRGPIETYLAQETRVREAQPPSPELAEKLRALGYAVEE